jgi:hypothetical protein
MLSKEVCSTLTIVSCLRTDAANEVNTLLGKPPMPTPSPSPTPAPPLANFTILTYTYIPTYLTARTPYRPAHLTHAAYVSS